MCNSNGGVGCIGLVSRGMYGLLSTGDGGRGRGPPDVPESNLRGS